MVVGVGPEAHRPSSASRSVLCTEPDTGSQGSSCSPPKPQLRSLASFTWRPGRVPCQSPSSLPTGLRPDLGQLIPLAPDRGRPGEAVAEKGRPGALDAPGDAADMLRCGR